MIVTALAALPLAIWVYLIAFRGGFWRTAERDDALAAGCTSAAAPLPAVTAVIPARNEADVLGGTVGSLLRQTYLGRFSIVVVDDQSADGTAEAAHQAAIAAGAPDRLTVVRGADRPLGWTGKLWAMRQGLAHVEAQDRPPPFILFTDADIAYDAPDALERLVRGSLAQNTVLTSLMVKLRCESFAERILIPTFVFFFQKLYPFAWVNDPRKKTAAAAGGCMLVRRESLQAAGGLDAIRSALVDDCALGRLMKGQGPIWLGLTQRVRSIRAYPRVDDIRGMVARTAYAELRYSPLRLAGAVAGMALTYLAPPLLAVFAHGPAQALGAAAWALMTLSFLPMLRFYAVTPLWSLTLPAIAACYAAFTVDSAWQHWQGRGGAWKGRFQAQAPGSATGA
jgi:hopene-associated glycosyltransferase HpnB